MTPQERQLVEELFDRLAQVENMPRDPEAERLIAQGVGRAPLMLDAIRGMFGRHGGGYAPSGLGNFAGDRPSPWRDSAGSAADSQLARDAGIDHVGDRVRDSRDQQALADADDDQDADQDDFDTDDWGSSDGGFDDA
jgi:hypothetical protein